MSEMGKKGGRIGGKRRLLTMTPERRREVALAAARARWDKTQPQAGPSLPQQFFEGDTVEFIDARTKETRYGRIQKMQGGNAIVRIIRKEQAGPNPKKLTLKLAG
jgi:hypothetical protein